jgi:hypothetical protein
VATPASVWAFGGTIFAELLMHALFNKINKQPFPRSFLPISYLLITLIFVFFGIFTIKGLYELGDLTKRIYKHPLVVSNASLYTALDIVKMHRSMKDAVLANSSGEMELALNAVVQSEKDIDRQLNLIQTYILGEEGKY